jgi:glutathione synthase/RimK-type ligase-like ATP-grasp enzyme
MVTKKLGSAELLFKAASGMGLRPSWLKPGAIFAIPTSDGERYINYSISSINSQLSGSMVGNKDAARLVLARRGFPTMAHAVPSDHTEAQAFLTKYKKIVVKPIKGSNSHDVHIVELPEQLLAFNVRDYIFEEYAPGKEVRYLLLNNKVIGVHESQYGESVAEDRDLKRISYPRADWDPALVALSLKVAKVFDLRFAAVDYIVGPEGEARILEVNSSPGMKWFHAPTSGPVIDVAHLFLRAMLDDGRSETPITSGSLVTSRTEVYS